MIGGFNSFADCRTKRQFVQNETGENFLLLTWQL